MSLKLYYIIGLSYALISFVILLITALVASTKFMREIDRDYIAGICSYKILLPSFLIKICLWPVDMIYMLMVLIDKKRLERNTRKLLNLGSEERGSGNMYF